jgi:hypothetical protein
MELNPQPPEYGTGALPFELQRRWLFGFPFSLLLETPAPANGTVRVAALNVCPPIIARLIPNPQLVLEHLFAFIKLRVQSQVVRPQYLRLTLRSQIRHEHEDLNHLGRTRAE